MNLPSYTIRRALLVLAAALLCAQLAEAQFFPGQFGGGGNTGRRGGGSSSNSRYSQPGEVGDAVISIDPETRNLIVIADDETSAYIQQVVQNLDRPKPQVLIKVVFLEVVHNKTSDIGVEGGWTGGMGNSATGAMAHAFGMSGINKAVTDTNNPVNMFGQPVSSFSPMPPGAGLYQVMAQDYQVTLRAIATAGNAKILSRPSVIARNNQPATLTAGQSVPLITSVRYDTFGNAINNVTYTDVGIVLRVTPFITSDGLVEMIVSPEQSSLVEDRSQWVPIATGASAPIINSRAADTVVLTPDGQTVIIGGLMSKVKGESESKIPLLGDIPFFGNLFKRRQKNGTDVELMIFLTPHIIGAPTEVAALTERERGKSDGVKGLTEQELEKFLETLPQVAPEEDARSNGKNAKPKKSE